MIECQAIRAVTHTPLAAAFNKETQSQGTVQRLF